jgi:N-carbamoyl-L-amino-acid hydrolase
MAALEVVRTLNDVGYETQAPIEIVAWTNEEGSRFSPAMVGSGAFAGVFDLSNALARPDNVTGVTLGAELERFVRPPPPDSGAPGELFYAIKGTGHRELGRQDRDAPGRVAGSVLEQRANAHAGSN